MPTKGRYMMNTNTEAVDMPELDRKALKEAAPMSSIPAAVERLTETIQRLENDARTLQEARERHGYSPDAKTELYRRIGDDMWRKAADKQAEADAYRAILAELSRLEDEAAKLRVERDEALEALKPFGEVAEWYHASEADTFEVWLDYPHGMINRRVCQLGNFRRAASLITKGGADV